jgi:rhodanese-related sulfurtransferase
MALSFFTRLFKKPLISAIEKGALIVDVRTPREYDEGRIPESINIPLDRLAASEQRLKEMNRPIIFCCASGTRSGQAYRTFAGKGFKNVYNGGSWMKLMTLLKNM